VIDRSVYIIELIYNRKRVHSGIHYLPPVEFEAWLADKKKKDNLGQINLKISDFVSTIAARSAIHRIFKSLVILGVVK